MTNGEKSAFLGGAAALTIGLVTGLLPATSVGAIVLLVAALTVVLRTTLHAIEHRSGSAPGR